MSARSAPPRATTRWRRPGTVFPESTSGGAGRLRQFGEPMRTSDELDHSRGRRKSELRHAASGGSLSSTITLTDVNGIASCQLHRRPNRRTRGDPAQVNGVEPLSFDETIT